MKKTLAITAIAATILSLSALTPAQAATTYECNGVKATMVAKTTDPSTLNRMGGPNADIIAVTGPKQGSPTVIFAGGGNDTICNLSSNSVLVTGGDGNDVYYGNNQPAYFYGGAGDDSAFGSSGAETFDGGPGEDYLYGGAGNDILSGNDGMDIAFGGTGTDIIIGGTGKDIVGGHGTEIKDDKVKDTIYASATELLGKGTGDVYKTLATDLVLYNAAAKKAFLAKYPKPKYTAYVNDKFIGNDTVISPNVVVYTSYIRAIWIAG